MTDIEKKAGNESKSLLDQILEFSELFDCSIEVKYPERKHIHVEIKGCVHSAGESNKLIQEKLCPGLSFHSVIIKENRFVFECVERDMTLIILYKELTA